MVNNTGFKRVKFSALDTVLMMAAIVGPLLLYLAILTGVGEPHMAALTSTVSNQDTQLLVCTAKYLQFNTTLYVIEGLFLLISGRLCWAIKDVPDSINESKYIALAMGVIILLCVLVLPIVYLLDLLPSDKEMVATVAFGLATMTVLATMVLPKAFILLAGMDVGGLEGALVPQVRPEGSRRLVPASVARRLSRDEHALKKEHKMADEKKKDELVMASSALKGSFADKIQIAREQVTKWKTFLIQLEEGSSGGSGSGGHSDSHGSSSNISSSTHPNFKPVRGSNASQGSIAEEDEEGEGGTKYSLNTTVSAIKEGDVESSMPRIQS